MSKTNKIVFTALMASAAFTIAIIMKLIPFTKMGASGGSLSLAMLPIFIVGYILGTKYGILAGVTYAIINFFFDGYGYHWASIIFDYLLAFGCLGLCGIFKSKALKDNKLINYVYFSLGMIIPSIIRFLMHTIAGTLAWETPFGASAIYNAPYVFASMLLCLIVGILIFPQLRKISKKYL